MKDMGELAKKLGEVQYKLKAPKGQTNNFGHYNYRSCEDILEAVKPLLHESGLTLTLSDDVIAVANRVYVKATATVTDGTESVSNTAFAREAESKKGMDDSQVTGTASSYARKYALNGLFCIDDTKDADTEEYQRRSQQRQQQPPQRPIMCTGCGKQIKPWKLADGRVMPPDAVARYAMKHANTIMCGDCLHAWQESQKKTNNDARNAQ